MDNHSVMIEAHINLHHPHEQSEEEQLLKKLVEDCKLESSLN